MLDYEWENPSSIMLSGGDVERNHHQEPHDPTRAALSVYDPTTHQSYNDHRHIISPPLLSSYSNNHLAVYGHQTTHITTNQYHHSFYDPRTTSYAADSIYPTHSNYFSFDQTGTGSGGSVGSPYNFLIPKAEVDVVSRPLDFTSSNRIGLNLGGRTYFSAADDDFVSRLYRRSRPGEPGLGNSLSAPRCQAEGCNADLSHAKHYHRRHKVCEFHSKASTVVAAGLSQRFCQQCSRFHLLSEFDNGKRSCRKRLADHNRRRRKCHQPASTAHDGVKTTLDTTTTPKSPNDSGTKSSSSPPNNNGLLSPPTISLECFRQRQFQTTTTPSSSTSASSSSNSMFFSSG